MHIKGSGDAAEVTPSIVVFFRGGRHTADTLLSSEVVVLEVIGDADVPRREYIDLLNKGSIHFLLEVGVVSGECTSIEVAVVGVVVSVFSQEAYMVSMEEVILPLELHE